MLQPSINGNLWPQGLTQNGQKKNIIKRRRSCKTINNCCRSQVAPAQHTTTNQTNKQREREKETKKNKRKYFQWREMECALICINYLSSARMKGLKDGKAAGMLAGWLKGCASSSQPNLTQPTHPTQSFQPARQFPRGFLPPARQRNAFKCRQLHLRKKIEACSLNKTQRNKYTLQMAVRKYKQICFALSLSSQTRRDYKKCPSDCSQYLCWSSLHDINVSNPSWKHYVELYNSRHSK